MIKVFKRIYLMLKSSMNGKWEQGYFRPMFPDKCLNIRNGKKIISRSSYERRFMEFLDKNTNVIEWASEVIEIPYIYDLDHKLHRYYPDMYVKLRKSDGTIETSIIEIKPKKQTIKPNPPKNKTAKAMKNYKYSVNEWIKNTNKWKSAVKFCESRQWKFKLLSEDNLF